MVKPRWVRPLVWLGLWSVLVGGVGGAYGATLTVTTLEDVVSGSLRQAIIDAAPGDTIDFAVSGTLTIDDEILLGKSLIIEGPGADNLEISGGNLYRVFAVEGPATLRNLTVANGFAEWGGGIWNVSDLIVEGVRFVNNRAATDSAVDFLANRGGAIVNGGTLTMSNATFVNNRALRGGAISNNGFGMTITDSTFSGNLADEGGAILGFAGGPTTLQRTTFVNNRAAVVGGAFRGGYVVTIEHCEFIGNTAVYSAGALGCAGCTISRTLFRGNSARVGGAISLAHDSLTVSDSMFVDNEATQDDGGAIEGGHSFPRITGSTFVNNRAADSGGAISQGHGILRVYNSTFSGNSAGGSGGAIETFSGAAEIVNVTATANSAGIVGGAFDFSVSSSVVGEYEVRNTVVAMNQPQDCRMHTPSSPIISAANLDSDGTCEFTGPGDLAGVDPQLAALADNGGPTLTVKPLPGSPLLDSGNGPTCTTTDQRGAARPQFGGCDRGAFEVSCGNAAVDVGEQCDDGNPIDGDGCDTTCTITGCTNGVLTAGEECDDGDAEPDDGCTNACTVCGNSVTSAPEECDDGNTVTTDGCTAACTSCGNAVVTPPEQCDDGNLVDGDGCSAGCTRETSHFLCHDAESPGGGGPFVPIVGVGLADRFASMRRLLQLPVQVCNPTDRSGNDPLGPSHPDRLVAYRTKKPPATGRFAKVRDLEVVGPFGTMRVDVLAPDLLMLPSATSVSVQPPAPAAPQTDPFHCYKIRRARGAAPFTKIRDLATQDMFGSWTFDLQKPKLLCAPVDLNAEAAGRDQHSTHLLCYTVRRSAGAPFWPPLPPLFGNNAFGPDQLIPLRPKQLCVPVQIL